MTTLSIHNCKILRDKKLILTNIFIEDGKIKKIGPKKEAEKIIDAKENILMPGLIDCHVHFREPGFPEKEDATTGSAAAAAGGVTTILDMPNTNPATFTQRLLEEKRIIYKEKCLVNYGFYIGAGSDNLEELKNATNVAGIKVYMNITTGKLLIENDQILQNIFSIQDKLFAVHAEGETFEKAISFFETNPTATLYLCHASLKREIEIAKQKKEEWKKVFIEVCTHHLFLTEKDRERLESYGIMKPPLAAEADQETLWQAINNGTVDTIATDHAPHTKEEKESDNPPFGVPGVETMLPLLLNAVHEKKLTLEKIQKLCCENPARIFGIENKGKIEEGFDADLVLIDFEKQKAVRNEELQTKCKWSPYHGWTLKGWPILTIVNGNIVFENNKINNNIKGKEVIFSREKMNCPEQRRQQEIARILLEKEAVIINATSPFTYASGIKSPIYCDNRLLLSFPEARDKIIDAMLHIIAQEVQNFDIIAGVATAGIPWASIIADRLEKPLIYIRVKAKEHGRENLIEGGIENGQRVLIIEDLISTGGSSLKAVEAVKETGAMVEYCVAVFSYEMKKAEKGFADAQCKLHTTTKFSQLVKEATIMKRISEQEESIVLEWNQDPENWGEKYGFQ